MDNLTLSKQLLLFIMFNICIPVLSFSQTTLCDGTFLTGDYCQTMTGTTIVEGGNNVSLMYMDYDTDNHPQGPYDVEINGISYEDAYFFNFDPVCCDIGRPSDFGYDMDLPGTFTFTVNSIKSLTNECLDNLSSPVSVSTVTVVAKPDFDIHYTCLPSGDVQIDVIQVSESQHYGHLFLLGLSNIYDSYAFGGPAGSTIISQTFSLNPGEVYDITLEECNNGSLLSGELYTHNCNNCDDTSSPIALCKDLVIDLVDNIVQILPSDLDDGSTDDCEILSYSLDYNEFDCSHIGDNEVKFSVADGAGNISTCNSTVTITDNGNLCGQCGSLPKPIIELSHTEQVGSDTRVWLRILNINDFSTITNRIRFFHLNLVKEVQSFSGSSFQLYGNHFSSSRSTSLSEYVFMDLNAATIANACQLDNNFGLRFHDDLCDISYISNKVSLFCNNGPVTPVNDVCSGAIPIIPSPESTGCSSSSTFTLPFLTDGTTDSGLDNSCNTIVGRDQFFTWTATSLSLLWNDLSPGNPGITIYENTGTTTNPSCGSEISCAKTFASPDFELNGWSIGDDLIIQVFDYSTSFSDVAFCLEEKYTATCPPSLTLFDTNNGDDSNINNMANNESSGFITSTQVIGASAIVDYDSATEIDLMPGFETELGAVFEAFIDGCGDGGGGSNNSSNWNSGNFTEDCEISVPSGAVDDEFGRSVAISGNTAVVGTYVHDVNAVNKKGKAYIFEKQGGCWNLVSTLISSDGEDLDYFGFDVDIFNDVVVVGAHSHRTNNRRNSGKAYVFQKPVSGWSGTLTESAVLLPTVVSTDSNFGFSTAISDNTIIIGEYARNLGGVLNKGKVYIYERPNSGWNGTLTESASIIASDGELNDHFGRTIDIDGGSIVVGSTTHNTNGTYVGKAYIYEKPNGGWSGTMTESAGLISSDGANRDDFAVRVSISGNTVAVGANLHDTNGNSNQGKVYIYERPNSGWNGTLTEVATLTASDGAASSSLGRGVSILQNTVLVGAYYHSTNGNQGQGKAYIFEKPNSGWSGNINETSSFTASDGTNSDFFGWDVDLSSDSAIISAFLHDANGIHDQGKAYLFLK